MWKSKDSREAEILHTMSDTLKLDPIHVTSLQHWFGTLSKTEREALHETLKQGAYTHAKPGITVQGKARRDATLERENEAKARKTYRVLQAILVAKSSYDSPGLSFQQHLQRAATVPYTNIMEANARLFAEALSLQQSMKKLTDLNQGLRTWTGWEAGKFRPLVVGCNIGRRGSEGPGTLGCFVTKPNGDVYILTNEHVLAQRGINNQLQDDAAIQPSHMCGGTFYDVVAENIETEPTLDAAIVKVKTGIHCHPVTLEGRAITGVSVATMNQTVYKRGCATKARIGLVIDDHAPDVPKPGNVRAINQILVRSHNTDAAHRQGFPFQVQGDSGSVALDDQGRVVALMHGQLTGTPEVGQATHIGPILTRFGITIMTANTIAP